MILSPFPICIAPQCSRPLSNNIIVCLLALDIIINQCNNLNIIYKSTTTRNTTQHGANAHCNARELKLLDVRLNAVVDWSGRIGPVRRLWPHPPRIKTMQRGGCERCECVHLSRVGQRRLYFVRVFCLKCFGCLCFFFATIFFSRIL